MLIIENKAMLTIFFVVNANKKCPANVKIEIIILRIFANINFFLYEIYKENN